MKLQPMVYPLATFWFIACGTTQEAAETPLRGGASAQERAVHDTSPQPERRIRCGLPPTRPSDLTVRFARTVYPRGRSPQQEERIITENCPPTGKSTQPCIAISQPTLDALYQTLIEANFAGLGLDSPGRASPHYGSRSLSLTWSDQTCEVVDSYQRTLSEADRKTFDQLLAALPPPPHSP
jgi:hypothetical protein